MAVTHTRMLRNTLARFSPADRAMKLPLRYDVSWALMNERGIVSAWAECQCIGKMKGGAVRMPLKNWTDGSELSRLGGKPFFIVVEWDDGIFYVRHDEVADHVSFDEIGGRTGEGGEEFDPCIFIPSQLFKPANVAISSSARPSGTKEFSLALPALGRQLCAR